jgi:hypothetical protein
MKGKFHARLYKPGDAAKVKVKDIFIGQGDLGAKIEANYKAVGSYVYTCLIDDDPIAILGWSFLFPGVVDLWSITSDRVRECGRSFYKFVMSLMKMGHENIGIYRYQMTVREGHQDLLRWAEGLKMKCEGFMEKFGPDKANYFIFARVY